MSERDGTGIRVAGLQVAPGEGRLARSDDAVLFVPAWDDGADALLAAFADAPAGGAVDAVTTAVVEHEFAVPPFACLAWSSVLSLVVFGDLAVQTDHPAVPLLSGAGSRTWVEHTLRRAADRVVVTVDPPEGDPPSDLVAGVVPAAGFALELVGTTGPARGPATGPSAGHADAAPEPASTHEPEVVTGHAGQVVSGSAPVPAVDPEPASRPDTDAPSPSLDPEPSPPPASSRPESSPSSASDVSPSREPSSDDLDLPPAVGTQDLDSLEAIRSAVVGDQSAAAASGTAPPAPPADATSEDAETDGGTARLDTPTTVLGGPALVEASTCPQGHLTPAGSTSCRVCGVGMAGDADVTTVRRPQLGVLRLDDGKMLPLDRNYRIGRRPSADDTATAAQIEGEKISRTHVEVVLRGWDVLVRDCDSTNGTWVASGPDEQFRRVDPDVPVRIEPGAVVRLDQRTLTYDGPAR
ncbi:FHA domain-containing protein [Salsipaludibacter albus]|uniref:FHA domain-containing protein n=1 Tax=Salsipaludibacter albus TaxID=2849650 RepID=UPI001EE4B1DE|nr:FHA domain-containing protein [Salsipaludibacter albus]MBY5161294.1 FHA domain-containing protein [Salsipaludibacter albus]